MFGGRIFAATVGAILVALASVAGAASATPPELPSDDFCFSEIRPCGDYVSLGEPRWETGKVIVYGYSSGVGPCIGFAHSDGGGESCGGNDRPPRGDPIALSGLGFSSAGHGYIGYTEPSGVLRPDVAAVRFRYRKKGHAYGIDAFVFQVEGKVQKQLKAPRPFGIFEASVPNCVQANHFRATAFAADGTALGTTRFPRSRDTCDRGPGTGGFIFFRDSPGFSRTLPPAS